MSRVWSGTLAREDRRENPDRYFYPPCKRAVPRPRRPRERLLDLGCGQGEMARFFRDLGYDVVGVDAARANLERREARRRLRALAGRPPDEERYHFRFFIRRKLRALLERQGFRIERRCSIGYYPLLNRVLFRRTRGLQKLRVPVPTLLETMFAENFVWLLRKPG